MAVRVGRRIGRGPPSRATAVARLERAAAGLPLRGEWIPVTGSVGRVTERSVRARQAIPASDLSAMDGYAFSLRPEERGRSRLLRPRRVVGLSVPGSGRHGLPRIGFASTVEVLTGAPLPPGANAVARAENCRSTKDRVRAQGPVSVGQDVVRRGEDYRRGSVIVAERARIRPWHVAALLANEVRRVRVLRIPRAGVLATGGEIGPSGVRVGPGTVPDTTRPLLLGMLNELGVEGVDIGQVPDNDRTIRAAVRRGLAVCDFVITIGGSSAGRFDRVPASLDRIAGLRWVVRRLRMRPGSTSSVAVVAGRPIFVLAGPPVAAFAGFYGLVEPFLRSRGLARTPAPAPTEARLDEAIPHSHGIRELVRVRLRYGNRGVRVSVVDRHGAGRLSSLTDADGLLELEEDRGNYRVGEVVRVVPFDGPPRQKRAARRGRSSRRS